MNGISFSEVQSNERSWGFNDLTKQQCYELSLAISKYQSNLWIIQIENGKDWMEMQFFRASFKKVFRTDYKRLSRYSG